MILTIIVPAYNVASTIERCLDSMLDERILDLIEVLVINDGSKDNTEEIVRSYCQQFSSVKLISKKNGGHGSTLNVGIVNAKGKYIRIVDGDDYVDTSNFVKSVLSLQSLDVDVVCMPYKRINLQTYESIDFLFPDFEPYFVHNIDYIDTSKLYLALAATCFSRDLLRRSCIRFLEKTYYVDVMLNILPIIYLTSIVVLPFDVYRYVVGSSEQSISEKNMVKRYKDHEKVILATLKTCALNKELIGQAQQKYINHVLGEIINTHLNILCLSLKDENEIKKFISINRKYSVITIKNITNRIYLLKIKCIINKISPKLTKYLSLAYKKIK